MNFNKTFLLALIVSVAWHLFWGLFFNLSLGKQLLSPGKIIPIYYVGRNLDSKGQIIREAGTVSSVFPPFTLPKIDFIQPPLPLEKLPEIEEEMLNKTVKEIAEYRTEISIKKGLGLNLDREPPSSWILPQESPKEKEYPIQWEGEKREIIYSYYPSYPRWAEEAGIISTVTLKFWVSRDGYIKDIKMDKSSGEAKLDLLAISYLRRWQFLPSIKNVESVGSITMKFRRKE
jgi:TonB family protein